MISALCADVTSSVAGFEGLHAPCKAPGWA